MDSIFEKELLFSSTFRQNPSKHINVPAHEVQSIHKIEPEISAGCYDFWDANFFTDRFIIWRASESSLYLEEYNVDNNSPNDGIVINFKPSIIIPGTRIVFMNGFFLILVPTQTSLHRIVLGLPSSYRFKKFDKGQGPSFISLLVDEFANSRNYYRYDLSNQINAMRAEIAQNEQDTLAIFCTVDDRTVFVELLHGVTTQPFCQETFLKVDSFLKRILRGGSDISLESKKEFSLDLLTLLRTDIVHGVGRVRSASLFIHTYNEIFFAILLLQSEFDTLVAIIKINPSGKSAAQHFQLFKILHLPSREVLNIACTNCYNSLAIHALCPISNGYTLLSSLIDCTTGMILRHWKEALLSSFCDFSFLGSILKNEDPAAKMSVIFNPDMFSIDVIRRAAQLVCKNFLRDWPSIEDANWKGLQKMIDHYISSPEIAARLSDNKELFYLHKATRVTIDEMVLDSNGLLPEYGGSRVERFICNCEPSTEKGIIVIQKFQTKKTEMVLGLNSSNAISYIFSEYAPCCIPAIEERNKLVYGQKSWIFERKDRRYMDLAVEKGMTSERVAWKYFTFFAQNYMSRGEKSLLLGNKSDDNGNEKFWNTFYRLCVQFQQNENQPLVTWSSSVFGLYGVITKGNFTICRPNDERMNWLNTIFDELPAQKSAFEKCMTVASRVVFCGMDKTCLSFDEIKNFTTCFSSVNLLIMNIITKLLEFTPIDQPVRSSVVKTSLAGEFTSRLVAVNFRAIIEGRLHFINCLIALISIVRWENTHVDLELIESLINCENDLHDANRQYTILSQAFIIKKKRRDRDFGTIRATSGNLLP
ncbi:unnamed protein product [Dracunculus medinensis]|uniref:Nucleoporin_N domain-containing protein n=1 Tax=Dracunculus medinensis TaxID=318479 RepID=A0A0N4UL67_DRAME|nr:unnamed protein product [Dracunculus medinensis]